MVRKDDRNPFEKMETSSYGPGELCLSELLRHNPEQSFMLRKVFVVEEHVENPNNLTQYEKDLGYEHIWRVYGIYEKSEHVLYVSENFEGECRSKVCWAIRHETNSSRVILLSEDHNVSFSAITGSIDDFKKQVVLPRVKQKLQDHLSESERVVLATALIPVP